MFVFTLRTHKTLPRLSRVSYQKSHQVSKRYHVRGEMFEVVGTMVELVGAPRTAVRLDTGLVARKSAEFLLRMLQNVESKAELEGSGIDFLVIEHIRVNKAPKSMNL